MPPRAKHIHISHTPPTPHIPRTTLIHNTSAALDIIPEPRVPPTCPAVTTPHPSPTPALPSTSDNHTLSADTLITQTTVHASQSLQPLHPHRVPQQPHTQTKDDQMITDTTHGRRLSSKSEKNLIILQVNINGIKNKLEDHKLLIHDTHADIIIIQETKLTLNPKHTKYITSQQCTPIRQEVGSLHSLETTLHSLHQTYHCHCASVSSYAHSGTSRDLLQKIILVNR